MQINYQPLKRKCGAFVIAVSLFELVGCAGPSYREKIDVYSFHISCKNAEKEIEFLEELKKTAKSEKIKAWWEVSFNPFVEDRDYKSALANGRVEEEIDRKIFSYHTCSYPGNHGRIK
jgi:hypothetical protein